MRHRIPACTFHCSTHVCVWNGPRYVECARDPACTLAHRHRAYASQPIQHFFLSPACTFLRQFYPPIRLLHGAPRDHRSPHQPITICDQCKHAHTEHGDGHQPKLALLLHFNGCGFSFWWKNARYIFVSHGAAGLQNVPPSTVSA